MPKQSGPSLFFLNFQGEFLSILLDSKLTTEVSDGESTQVAEIPMTLQAFLIDEDEQYLYLGKEYDGQHPTKSVDRAVPKNRIIYVEILNPEIEAFRNMDVPQGSIN